MARTSDTKYPEQPVRTPSAPPTHDDEALRSEGPSNSGFWLAFESRGGCIVQSEPSAFVRSVEEARRTLVRTARGILEERKPHEPDPQFFRFPPGSESWEDLVRCESYRCYDPTLPDKGMEVSYALYEEGGLSGVGGMIWTYGVDLTVTGPPEVWDHPAHLPCGLHLLDG